MADLDGKVAIVTGGTGALGGAVVRAFLEAGAAVVAPYRRAGDLADLRAQAGIATEAPLSGMELDLTDEEAVARAYADLEARLRETCVLIPLWYEDQVAVLGPRAQGFVPSAEGRWLGLARL